MVVSAAAQSGSGWLRVNKRGADCRFMHDAGLRALIITLRSDLMWRRVELTKYYIQSQTVRPLPTVSFFLPPSSTPFRLTVLPLSSEPAAADDDDEHVLPPCSRILASYRRWPSASRRSRRPPGDLFGGSICACLCQWICRSQRYHLRGSHSCDNLHILPAII